MNKLDRRTNDLRYLRRRPGHAWEVVVPVPRDLRPLFGGQTRMARSLRTESLAEARRRRWPVREELLQSFDAARAARRLSLPEMEAQAARFYAFTFETALKWTAAARDATADMWLEALHGSSEERDENPDGDHMDPEVVAKEIAAIRQRTGCQIEGGDLRALARGLLRAGVAGVLGADAIKQGGPADAPELPWVIELTRPGAWNGSGSPTGRPMVHRGHDGSPLISEALKDYLKDRQADPRTALSGRFAQEVGTTIRRLIDHLGDVHLGSVTRKDASGFVGHLMETTARSTATANKSVTACAGLWKWAVRAGVLDDDAANPWSRLSRPVPRADRVSWLPYTNEEIEKLWGALTEHGARWRHPERHTVAAALPWLWAISLLGGLRLEEVAGLRCHDVRGDVGDVPLFDVVEHQGRRLKSGAAVRRVPVHAALIDMGLLDYRDAIVRDHGLDALLFPGLSPSGPDRKLSAAASKLFGRLRRSAGVTRARVGYHSTRAWFATSLEHADVPVTLASLLLGHSGENGARGLSYGRYSSGPALRQLKEAVERIEAPKVLLRTWDDRGAGDGAR
jgi:integrase